MPAFFRTENSFSFAFCERNTTTNLRNHLYKYVHDQNEWKIPYTLSIFMHGYKRDGRKKPKSTWINFSISWYLTNHHVSYILQKRKLSDYEFLVFQMKFWCDGKFFLFSILWKIFDWLGKKWWNFDGFKTNSFQENKRIPRNATVISNERQK